MLIIHKQSSTYPSTHPPTHISFTAKLDSGCKGSSLSIETLTSLPLATSSSSLRGIPKKKLKEKFKSISSIVDAKVVQTSLILHCRSSHVNVAPVGPENTPYTRPIQGPKRNIQQMNTTISVRLFKGTCFVPKQGK